MKIARLNRLREQNRIKVFEGQKPTVIKRYEPKSYRDGGEGMIQWCNDYVSIPLYPEGSDVAVWTPLRDLSPEINPKTGKSAKSMWLYHQDVLREALQMKDERFLYRLIVFCWMRGEAKSLLACLVQMWKFFNWPRQQIMLGANSKDQTKFVHYDIIRDIILNSPELLAMIGGDRNLQEKEIRMVDRNGNVKSIIRSISSFSGIVSNITGYTFSEIFDMKNPKFFVQLDGSIRTIPNALGVIDSTVSTKDHVLYKLYSNFVAGKSKTVFFSYRYSRRGEVQDYWNPNMDEEQLHDYQLKFPAGEFERYFLNRWDSGNLKCFSDEMIKEIGIIGADKYTWNHQTVAEILEEIVKIEMQLQDIHQKKVKSDQKTPQILQEKTIFLQNRLEKVDNLYVLRNKYGYPEKMSNALLNSLGTRFDTDWAILAGLDMADPFALRKKARSIVFIVAKGLLGSRSQPFAKFVQSPKYIYLLLNLAVAEQNSTDNMKDILEDCDLEYDGIDTLCSERYGTWDIPGWCEEHNIAFEPVFPNYDRQREAFKEFYVAIKEGRFKAPELGVPGSKQPDIFVEELGNFDHDSDTKWFGSSEKMETRGIQDDTIFAGMWCLYGGRMLTVDNFRPRNLSDHSFGYFQENRNLLAKY